MGLSRVAGWCSALALEGWSRFAVRRDGHVSGLFLRVGNTGCRLLAATDRLRAWLRLGQVDSVNFFYGAVKRAGEAARSVVFADRGARCVGRAAQPRLGDDQAVECAHGSCVE